MDLKLYKIFDNDFIAMQKITPADIVVVENTISKKIYLYKGERAAVLDEFESSELYDQIVSKFLTPQIFLIQSMDISVLESEEIREVKEFIRSRYPNMGLYKIGHFFRTLLTLNHIPRNLRIFHQYEHSGIWRRRLSNQTNFWRLSILNVVLSLVVMLLSFLIILLAIKPIYILTTPLTGDSLAIWLQNLGIYQIIVIAVAGILMIVNLLFVLFPLRFPIKPKEITQLL